MIRDVSGFTRIVVKPVAGALGAEIEGVDLRQPLDDATFAELHRAWLQNGVVFLRGQRMTPDSMEAVARRFGDLAITSYTNPVPGFKFAHLNVRPAEAPRGSRNYGDFWHIDQTTREIPNAGFLLCAQMIPPYGGDTGFASTSLAYDMLSPGMQALCDRLVCVHTPAGVYGDGSGSGGKRPFRLPGSDKAYTISDEKLREYLGKETLHPLIVEHPETGRKGIYYTPYVTRFTDMTEAESKPILDYLATHMIRPEFTCRFRWEVGSLAIIDNRALQHFAYQDYHGHRREMLRCEFASDVAPYGPAMPRKAARVAAE